MNDIARQLNAVKSTLPAGVALVAVSKFHPVETLREAYDAGQRIFGESRVQELVAKKAALPGGLFISSCQFICLRRLRFMVPSCMLLSSSRLLPVRLGRWASSGLRRRRAASTSTGADRKKTRPCSRM